jgi:RHS repeat-associated protein
LKYYSFGGQTIMRDGNGDLQYFLTDHLGSVVAVTDSDGTLTSQQRYLPFGQVREDVGTIAQTDFGYTGQRALDSGMGGLMDYKARFYDPYLNRFIQPDSVVPGSSPQALNRYAYVNNSPINFNDPEGHKPCWAGKKYRCNLTQEIVDREYAKYKDKDKPAVAAFFANQGFAANSATTADGWGGEGGLSMGGGTPGYGSSSSGGGLDFTGYSNWETQILQELYASGGPYAVHGVNYILANNIHIGVAPWSAWQGFGSVDGWYNRGSNTIFLNPHVGYNTTDMPRAWGLGTIIHEAKHLEQGAPLTKYKELEAAQIGISVAANLGQYGAPGQLPGPGRDADILSLNLSHDLQTINRYSYILRHDKDSFRYWIFYNLLPIDSPRPRP